MINHQPQLQTLATSDPDWPSFATSLPQALLSTETPLPNQVAEDTAKLLCNQRPELAAFLNSPPPANKQTLNIIPIMLTAGALLFLLRTHISFQRTEDGKISFSIVHPGMDNELVTKIVETLRDWASKSK